MKKGINQWAFPEAFPADKAMTQVREAGFETFELCVGEQGPLTFDVSEKELTSLRRRADRLGLALTSVASGMGWQYPLSSPDTKVREKAKALTTRLLHIAAGAGADAVLVVPGVVDPQSPYDEAIERSLDAIQDLVPLAEQLHVCLAIENVWNKFLLSPVEMRDFLDQFESGFVGAYVDVGNVIAYGYPEQWIRILGQRVRKIHMKDFRASTGTLDGFVMLMEGDVNWPAVMAALRATGYTGPLTAEYWPYKHGHEVMLRQIGAALDAILAL